MIVIRYVVFPVFEVLKYEKILRSTKHDCTFLGNTLNAFGNDIIASNYEISRNI